MKRVTVHDDEESRFRTYLVRAQRSGDPEAWGETITQTEGKATDPEVLRPRVKLVVADQSLDQEGADKMAAWHAAISAARAWGAECQTPGWRSTVRGALWGINQLARLVFPPAGLDRRLLVNALTFERDEKAGQTTELELVRTSAYRASPEVPDEGLSDALLSPELVEPDEEDLP